LRRKRNGGDVSSAVPEVNLMVMRESQPELG